MKQSRHILVVLIAISVLLGIGWLFTRPSETERRNAAFDQALGMVLTGSTFQSTRDYYGPPNIEVVYYPLGSFPPDYTPHVDGFEFRSVDLAKPPNPLSARRLTVGLSGSGITQPGSDQLSTYWNGGGDPKNEFIITVWNSGGTVSDGVASIGHCYATFIWKDRPCSRDVQLVMVID